MLAEWVRHQIGKLVANHFMRLNSESVSKNCWKEREQKKFVLPRGNTYWLLIWVLVPSGRFLLPKTPGPRGDHRHMFFLLPILQFLGFLQSKRKICAVVSQKGGACKRIFQLAYAIFINFQLFLHSLIHENCKHQHGNKLPKMNSFWFIHWGKLLRPCYIGCQIQCANCCELHGKIQQSTARNNIHMEWNGPTAFHANAFFCLVSRFWFKGLVAGCQSGSANEGSRC